MIRSENRVAHFNKDKVVIGLTAVYFIVAVLEIMAEYFRQTDLIYSLKPLLMPLLIVIYCRTSPKINYFFIVALIFSWIANFFFIPQTFSSIFIGAIFFFFYRSLIIYIVLKHIRLPGIFPIVVGCVPFLFIYMYVVNLTFAQLGDGLVIFVVQCLIISFLGGLSVGNYMIKANRPAILLLLSTMLFAITQFIFVVRLFYKDINIFQPTAMALFALAQYYFYRFLLLSEWSQAANSADHSTQNDS